jgi:hypothetical protein
VVEKSNRGDWKEFGVDHHGRHGRFDGFDSNEGRGGVKDPDDTFQACVLDGPDVSSELPDLGRLIVGYEEKRFDTVGESVLELLIRTPIGVIWETLTDQQFLQLKVGQREEGAGASREAGASFVNV